MVQAAQIAKHHGMTIRDIDRLPLYEHHALLSAMNSDIRGKGRGANYSDSW